MADDNTMVAFAEDIESRMLDHCLYGFADSTIHPGNDDDDALEWTTMLHSQAPFHLVLFERKNDNDDNRDLLVIIVPEHHIETQLTYAHTGQERVAFLCDTAERAQYIAALATANMPDHRRISLERARAGGWGRLT
jgi:hypothetical protein